MTSRVQVPDVRSLALESDCQRESAASVVAASGDAISFDSVFEENFDYLCGTLRRLGVGLGDIEDVAHEVFLLVHKKLSSYDPSRPLRPWLFAFAYRFAADYRKRARHRRELPDRAEDHVDPTPGPESEAIRSERLRFVLRVLDSLDLDRRAVLILHEIDGTTMPEVARALEIPLNTAYSRLRLALRDFAQIANRLRLEEGEP